jgi:endonuclease VIII
VVPEGDTIHRAAGRLRTALEGRELRRFEAPRLVGERPRPGAVIDSVEAVGKHLLMHFSSGLTLQTHMRMTGSWHLYRVGERWQKAEHLARVVVGVDDWVAVCFSAPVVRTYRTERTDSPVAHLGPDLCRDDADLDAVVRRMGEVADADSAIADVLLDQRIASGIGNVYKSETLFACALDPFTPLRWVDKAMRRRLVETAAGQLRANLGAGPRTTVPGGLAVYGRQRQPCRRCGTPVRAANQGPHARVTFWCPVCQPPMVDDGGRDGDP